MGNSIKNWELALCFLFGNFVSLILTLITEYFTSHYYSPVRSLLRISEGTEG